jgi:hypothetical protein
MEKIYFDETTFIWKTKLNLLTNKNVFLKEAEYFISLNPNSKTDSYPIVKEWNNNLDFKGNFDKKIKLNEIVQLGMDICKSIYDEKQLPYNKINVEAWVNVVRSKNPIQSNFYNTEEKYHVHTDINKENKSFFPNYTFVYYIQMPDEMCGEDGVLYVMNKSKKEYFIMPEEGDLIIMEGDLPHTPNNAPNSTIDRIVVAGNIGFDFIKKEKSLI